MEQFSELARNRRSHRKFTDERVTEEQLQVLLDAALMAPTSKGMHSYSFCVVENAATLAALSQCKSMGSQFLSEAPCAIVVMAEPEISDVWIEDASIATLMIQLQAEDMGLGSCWIQVRERFTATGIPSGDFVHNVLDIPLQLQVLSIVAIGHKGMERKPFNEEHLQWEKIHINKYGGE